MSKTQKLLLAGFMVTAMGASAVTPHSVSTENLKVSEDFNSMWDAEKSEALLSLPEGWAMDRNLSAPRKVGNWSDGATEVMYTGGVSLASNAKNGTWSFGDSSNENDRALGGLTTTVDGGTRGVSIMTAITNDAETPIDRFNISYAIEKYRKGDNAAGFAVQLYYSNDGEEWIDAGDTFYTFFEPDDETLGTAVVPISTTSVNEKTLMADVAPGATIYLAWNISVASGSSPNKAPGLALDDIEITATYANEDAKYLYIENALKAANLSVYSSTTDFFGAEPGMTSSLSKKVNGVEYALWEMPADAPIDITVVANNTKYDLTGLSNEGDTYLSLSKTGLDVITDPESYTGWVDPDRKPFVSSGIYIRGEINSWGADSEWEFSKEEENTYVLYDKQLSGAFKVADADWSDSCNYGSNGTNVMVGTPYSLTKGTDSNISCGAYTFDCKRIVLSIVNDNATLLLEADDDETNLTSVYVYGDFNSWDFMSKAGELKLDTEDNLFKGQISMKGGADGLSHWRIYQRPGLGGAWGLEEDAEESALIGNMTKGSTGNAAVTPGTYAFTFSLEDGSYTLTAVEAAPAVMALNPALTYLTPENPENVKILSLNNSLIHYNDQDFVFNDIAKAMGVKASWTKHTNLGKPLSYHWNEGEGLAEDGTPGAKMMIRSDAWSHIILQEQSSLPRTNPETFRNSVSQWIEYIRENCPNPNAVILIPVNWAYSSDLENFNSYNNRFMEVYSEVAAELGAVVVPVALAYDNAYTTEGATELNTWFSDDRHPTPKATYMAACMEFGAILGVDPATITYKPADLTADVASKMRTYASEALSSYTNTVSHLDGMIRFNAKIYDDFGIELPAQNIEYSIDGGGTISPEGVFVSDGTRGTFNITATCVDFTKTAQVNVTDHSTEVISFPAISLNADNLSASENFDSMGLDAEATLPEAWRIDRQTKDPRTLGTYATALSQTAYSGGTNLPSNAKNGIWNFGADEDTDRAPGGITTGVENGARAINLYSHIINDGRKPLQKVKISYDVEKYRKGNNPAGFAVQLYYSYDGRNWENAGDDFYTFFAADDATEGYAEVPGETVAVEGTLPISVGAGLDIYLAWNISVASGDAANGAMALGIDNVTFEGELPEVPETIHRIYVDNQTSWDALGVYAYNNDADKGEIFGGWPGQAPIDEQEIDGVTYKVFGLDVDHGSYNLIFNNWNKGLQLSDYPITADRDYWFQIDDNKVTELHSTGISSTFITSSDLKYDGKSIITNENSEIKLYNTNGVLIATGNGPIMSLDSISEGLYIVVCQQGALKINIR